MVNVTRNKRIGIRLVLTIFISYLPRLHRHVLQIFRHHIFRHDQVHPMLPRGYHDFGLLIEALLHVSKQRVNLVSSKVNHFLF